VPPNPTWATDHDIVAAVGRDSRTVLSEVGRAPDLTLAYGDGPDRVADVRLPDRRDLDSPLTMVLFLHGGFWRDAWDRAHTGPLATALAERGMVVVTPEYRRVGPRGVPVGWPDTFDDVRSAVRELPALVTQRSGVGVERLVLAGHSAGGHLALWAAGEIECAVVALAPVADLRAAYHRNLDGDAVAALLGGGPDEVQDRYAAADPMARLPLGRRTVLVHGDRDAQVPVDLSRRYAEAARAAGDAVTLLELSGVDHFQVIDPQSPAWSRVVAAFIDDPSR
jgi:acetyl esterase/lipase